MIFCVDDGFRAAGGGFVGVMKLGVVGEDFSRWSALEVAEPGGSAAQGVRYAFEAAATAPLEMGQAAETVLDIRHAAEGVVIGGGPVASAVFVEDGVEPFVHDLLEGVVGVGDFDGAVEGVVIEGDSVAVQIRYCSDAISPVVSEGRGCAGKSARDVGQETIGVVGEGDGFVTGVGEGEQLAVGVVAEIVGLAGGVHGAKGQMVGVPRVAREGFLARADDLADFEEVNVVGGENVGGGAAKGVNVFDEFAEGVVIVLVSLGREVVEHAGDPGDGAVGALEVVGSALALVSVPDAVFERGFFAFEQAAGDGVVVEEMVDVALAQLEG